jgi:hypothetical protein
MRSDTTASTGGPPAARAPGTGGYPANRDNMPRTYRRSGSGPGSDTPRSRSCHLGLPLPEGHGCGAALLVMNSCMCRHSAAGCSSGMKWPAPGMSLVVSCRIPAAWRLCAPHGRLGWLPGAGHA